MSFFRQVVNVDSQTCWNIVTRIGLEESGLLSLLSHNDSKLGIPCLIFELASLNSECNLIHNSVIRRKFYFWLFSLRYIPS